MPPEGQLRGHRDEAGIAAQIYEEPVPEITADMTSAHDPPRHRLHRRPRRGRRVLSPGARDEADQKSVNQDDPDTLHYFWANYDGRAVAPASSMTLFGWPADGRRAREGVGQTHHIAFRAAE